MSWKGYETFQRSPTKSQSLGEQASSLVLRLKVIVSKRTDTVTILTLLRYM